MRQKPHSRTHPKTSWDEEKHSFIFHLKSTPSEGSARRGAGGDRKAPCKPSCKDCRCYADCEGVQRATAKPSGRSITILLQVVRAFATLLVSISRGLDRRPLDPFGAQLVKPLLDINSLFLLFSFFHKENTPSEKTNPKVVFGGGCGRGAFASKAAPPANPHFTNP